MTRVPAVLRAIAVSLGLTLAGLAPPARAQAAPADSPPPGYARVADLALAAPVIADVVIHGADRLKPAEAAGAPPGATRFYVTADVLALVRGAGGLPPRVGYLLDVLPAADGRLPKLRKTRALLFARPVAGAADQLQLVSPEAQQDWTPALDALTRRIVRDALAADAPPVVTGVASAFHVAGALPGEGETQIFLTTADARPVSLSILRRPGERPRWAVALSEIVDEAAAPPPRDSLLWYRLACFLPRALPEPAAAALSPEDAGAAREDYGFVLGALGPCGDRAAVSR